MDVYIVALSEAFYLKDYTLFSKGCFIYVLYVKRCGPPFLNLNFERQQNH